MKEVSLVRTSRSWTRHITASSVQSHIWYRDDYIGTLCGQWLQVGHIRTLVNLDKLDGVDGVDGSLCGYCYERCLHIG